MNFTRVLLNNAPVAVASTGRTDAQNTNREVDLDLFPTELFTQLTVRKSASAAMLEGGAAGTVDMRSARPFDNGGGPRVTYALQGTKNTNADQWGERASVLASTTWGDKFGALVGLAGVHSEVRVTGFETIGLDQREPGNADGSDGDESRQSSTSAVLWAAPRATARAAATGRSRAPFPRMPATVSCRTT